MRFLLFVRHNLNDKKIKSCQKGFTLIELLLVITLVAILAIAAISSFDGTEEQGRQNITRLEMAELQKALLQFRRDNRELPCMVYRHGNYSPDKDSMTRLDFADLTATPNLSNYHDWCDDSYVDAGNDVIQPDNALSMLNTFPYPVTTDNTDLMWNRDSQRGWNGPYINVEGLTDGWGNRYRLLDPELSFNQLYRCENDSGSYAIDGTTDEYICLSPNDPVFDNATDILPADIARIVSTGPDGILDSELSEYTLPVDDPCVARGDDFVLCLLR
jgi:prepilin-type N-terminal cleavage/methylation domain-containing protein